MSEEIPSDGAYKPRSALGDVTNRVEKRGVSLISTSCVKSGGDDYKKDEVFQSAKKECLRVDGFKNENLRKEIAESVLRPHSCSEISSLQGNIISCISKVACEIKEPCPPDPQNVSNFSTAVKSGGSVRDNSLPSNTSCRNSPQLILEVEDDERTDSVVAGNPSKENDASIDNLDSSKDEDLDCSRLLESQESRCGLERCIGQKGDGLSSMCMDLIKACPCSFCMKAAYLWSDLHYQDIKGRIAVIKSSQKEASILVNQNSKDDAVGRYESGNLEKSSNLESDLKGRWKSLFLHTEDLFVREGTQLETSLSTLKELRDSCMTDSEKN